MNFLKVFISKYTKTAIVLPVLVSLILGTGIFRIRINDDLKEMLPDNIPSKSTFAKLEQTFGASQFIAVTMGGKDFSVFNRDTLSKLKRMTDEFGALPFVERVRSLSNASLIRGDDSGMEVLPLMEEVPSTRRELESLERLVFNESEYEGTFVSKDRHYLSIYVFLSEESDASSAFEEIKKIVDREKKPEEIYMNGEPVIKGIISKFIRKDLTLLIPLVLLVLSGILYAGLRHVGGVLLVLFVVIMSVIPAVGLMGLLNRSFMVVSSAMPIILLALACAYSIHIIMKFYDMNSGRENAKESVCRTVDELFLPITAAALTTIVGFLSLVTSPLPPLFEFGVFVSAGIAWAWILSLTTLPALLIVLPRRASGESAGQGGKEHRGFFNKVSVLLARIVNRHKIGIIISYAALTCIFALGISSLRIETNLDRFFDRKSEITLANRISAEHFGGSANLNIMVEGDILDPVILNSMLGLQSHLEGISSIGDTSSIADVVCILNKAVNNNNASYKKIPATKQAVSQLLMLYSMSADPQDLAMLVDSDYTIANLNIRMASVYSRDVKRIQESIAGYFKEHFPQNVKYQVTGSSVFTKDISEMTAISSIQSILVSLIAVFFIAVLLYRSLVFGLVSVIPLSITMIVIFGFMGLAGIDFSIEIAVICSIIIGVGIDYALHYIARYCLVANTASLEERTKTAINETGPPILSNAVSISTGFLVLIFSLLIPIKTLGILVFISMMIASVSTLTMLGAMLNVFKPRIRHGIKVFTE